MRIALGVEYDGSEFSGWETQRERSTVQGTLESALSTIANEPIQTVCAGRTDSGVHAWGQVVHFDAEVVRPLSAWTRGTNSILPSSVSVGWAIDVEPEFHARFSAVSRRYRYVIVNRPNRSGVLASKVAHVYQRLNLDRMRSAGQYLLGEHDFSAFRASGCQAKSPRRRIYRIEIERHGELVSIEVIANAFLQHMVRNLAGSLVEVGTGRREPRWMQSVLLSCNRSLAGPTMCPDGLYLVEVIYPGKFKIPSVCPSPPL